MGLDYKAISAALGITVSAARKRIQYAKENLSQLLRIGGVNLE
jgi:DNA-directed RNA polymerase specialized sigma24 family protein